MEFDYLFYDKVYDKGFIGISTKHEVLFSKFLADHSAKDFYSEFFSASANRHPGFIQ